MRPNANLDSSCMAGRALPSAVGCEKVLVSVQQACSCWTHTAGRRMTKAALASRRLKKALDGADWADGASSCKRPRAVLTATDTESPEPPREALGGPHHLALFPDANGTSAVDRFIEVQLAMDLAKQSLPSQQAASPRTGQSAAIRAGIIRKHLPEMLNAKAGRAHVVIVLRQQRSRKGPQRRLSIINRQAATKGSNGLKTPSRPWRGNSSSKLQDSARAEICHW
ncbi:hypothetical protein GOODEAATRI_016751 [Goodea atripinnis]|uniref:Uncharacterized protein n=1 Tax=Goodea atripinnis TaxID=208336 RepID=A0ABV0PPF4_9TELE